MNKLHRREFLHIAIGAVLGIVSLCGAGFGYSGAVRSDRYQLVGGGRTQKAPIPNVPETQGEENGDEAQGADDASETDEVTETAEATDGAVAGPVSTVTCLGDSLTYGEGAYDPETQSWPAVLGRLLGDGYQVHNFGVCGATVIDSSDVPYRAMGLVEQAAALRPSVATIMFGTNDSRTASWDPETFRAGLVRMIEDLHTASPKTRIVLIAPPRPFEAEFADFYDGVDPDPAIRDQVRPLIRATSVEMGLGYIDLYRFTSRRPEWYSDGIHLNAEGYEAVAYEIFRYIW